MKVETYIISDYTYNIWIGKNAKDNWDIIDKSSQNDIWFHLGNEVASPHVILKNPDNIKKIDKKVLNYCALLCKTNSKMCDVNKTKIIYTSIKNIEKADVVGSVYTKNTKVITI